MKRVLTILILTVVAFGGLAGCGSSGRTPTRFLVVSDLNNNRVLIYNKPLSNGQSANIVLGQNSFTTNAAALTASGMYQPVAAAEDSAGNIYVSEYLQARVLQFKPPFTNGMSASLVFGQPDFTTGTGNTTQNGLHGPTSVAIDSSGNLWVADAANNRILQYKPPFSNGMDASLVLGQANFNSFGEATTNSGLHQPLGLAFDPSGNLWVVDGNNNRVLEFKAPFANGESASVVIGQSDFTSSGTATTASGLNFPRGVAFDSSGNLWVADAFNFRILQYKPPFSNGMDASLVLGQPDFTTHIPATTQSGLSILCGIGFDSSGNLAVADQNNNRIVGFQPPFSNNQNASLVLGQADFNSHNSATTATGQSQPCGVLAAF